MKIVSLLSVLLLVYGVSSDTIFRANGTLTCKYHWPTWCFTIQWWEQDVSFLLNMDDLIATQGGICRQTDTVDYSIQGSQDWDGINDDFFETQIEINHNCTYSGVRRVARVPMFTRVGTPEVFVTFDADVTHMGDKVSDYFKAH